MNKNINITLYMTHTPNSQIVDTNAVFKSKDIGVVDIVLSVYRHKLKDTDKVQVLTVFENSGSRLITEAIVANGVATYEFDTSLITGNDKVSNYVYLDFDGKKADLGGFTFKTELSEIDESSEQIRFYYDKRYEDLIEDFSVSKQAMVVVNHGEISDTPRPPGAVAVYWIGAAEPYNSSDNDLWIGS